MRCVQAPSLLTPFTASGTKAQPAGKAALGQYMTPHPIAAFMASLFPQNFSTFHLLDAGAGRGSLTCAFLDALRQRKDACPQGEVSLVEYDANLLQELHRNATKAIGTLLVQCHVQQADFIAYATELVARKQRPFTHAILNPPYKKIRSDSTHRALLHDVGIETVNLYTAFVALSLALLQPGGTLMAIIPRSFCNGPYYRPFRYFVLQHAAIRSIHLFTSRTEAFKADKVLQENILLTLERDAKQAEVIISCSENSAMDDYHETKHPFGDIVRPEDSEKFFFIPHNQDMEKIPLAANRSLTSLGLDVSTGPVVDFRLKEYLHPMPLPGDVPLLYPGHFNGSTQWPRHPFKKPNALAFCPETRKWLYPNGHYVIVRRLSSKEEKRRVTAYHVQPESFPGQDYLAFENHLNVFHRCKRSLPRDLAHGLMLYLNTPFVDAFFRCFNGHTQVNATDLRSLPYPSASILTKLGQWALEHPNLSQEEIEYYLNATLIERQPQDSTP